MRGLWYFGPVVVALFAQPVTDNGSQAEPADNTLSSTEKEAEWALLFNGKTLDGWQTSSKEPGKIPVENGCINPHGCGGYMMIHEKAWSDYVLALDFKISKGCNSGVFIRTHPLDTAAGEGCRVQWYRDRHRRHQNGRVCRHGSHL